MEAKVLAKARRQQTKDECRNCQQIIEASPRQATRFLVLCDKKAEHVRFKRYVGVGAVEFSISTRLLGRPMIIFGRTAEPKGALASDITF